MGLNYHPVMKNPLVVLVFCALTAGNCAAQVAAQTRPIISGISGSGTGQQITIEFPGYVSLIHGDGTGSSPCQTPPGGINCQGIWSIYDLKNDPRKIYQWGAQDTGLSQHQWNSVKNANGSERWGEVKEGGQPCAVTETNNVRTVLTCAGPVYRYGNKVGFPEPDCCVKLTKSYALYRHGGAATGKGGLKVYTETSLLYDGSDNKGPLILPNNNLYTDFMWAMVSGEDINSDHTSPPNCGHFGVLTPSPLNLQYQNPGAQGNKDYNLLTPKLANSSLPGEFLPANQCATLSGHGFSGPEGAPGQPAPGTVFRCNAPSATECTSQTALGQILHMNILQISKQPITYMNLTGNPPAVFFLGGIRFQNFLPADSLAAGKARSWSSVFFLGDNGVTSTKVADALTAEYKKAVPAITIKNGIGGKFDAQQGYWRITKTNDPVSISAEGELHSPAFLVSGWSAALPSTITVGGAAKVLNSDFVAASLGGSQVLVQLLFDTPKGAAISFSTTRLQ
jgi:hypothetical protein